MIGSLGAKWLCGYRKLCCQRCHGVRLLNLMLSHRIDYFGLDRDKNGDMTFFIMEKEYKILMSILDKNHIKVYSVYGRGLPFVIKNHKNRAGLLAGLMIYIFLVYFSTRFIWDIRVTSDTVTPHNEILSGLAELGCYEGSYVSALDFDRLCIDFLAKHKEFSWMSVNVKGTVAYVEVQEKDIFCPDSTDARNLIAGYGGIIESVSVYEGEACVVPGNVVKPGDLLISGITEDFFGRTHICRARGEIVASVDTVIEVMCPYSHTERVYTGKSYQSKTLRFFNFKIPYSTAKPPKGSKCIQINEENGAVLFDRIELPLSIEKTVFKEYKEKTVHYSKKEAELIAEGLLRQRIDTELSSPVILATETKGKHSKEGYTLTCKIKCKMDITIPSEILT